MSLWPFVAATLALAVEAQAWRGAVGMWLLRWDRMVAIVGLIICAYETVFLLSSRYPIEGMQLGLIGLLLAYICLLMRCLELRQARVSARQVE
jgi:hypothetical protein